MGKDLDTLLDQCIDRMNKGASLEDCIADHPEHAEELKPLLRALNEAHEICSTMPRAAAKTVIRQRLDSALAYNEGNARKIHWRPSLLFSWSRTKATLAVVLILALLSVGLFWAFDKQNTPVLANILPENNSVVLDRNTITIIGQTQPDAIVLINGEITNIDTRGYFSSLVSLHKGLNVINVTAIDENGNEKTNQIVIFSVETYEQLW